VRDVVATQQIVADLLIDPEARRAWEADPAGFASERLGQGDEAAMVASLDPAGVAAAARSHVVKKERFDYLHRLHHEHEDRKAARATGDHHHDHGRHPDGHDHRSPA